MQTEETIANTEPVRERASILPQLCRYACADSPLPLVAVEGKTHIIRYANPAFCQLSALSSAELLGKSFGIVAPEGTANQSDALLDRVFRTGKTEILAEQKHISAVPDTYWSYMAWAIFDDAERPIGLMVQITDTSVSLNAREQSVDLSESLMLSNLKQDSLNARLERAMQETDHRVKNNLQIISSLVEMEIAEGEAAAPIKALKRIASYIHSIALLHDLLAQKAQSDTQDDTLSTVDSLALMTPLLQSSVGEARRIVIEVEDFGLPASSSVSLSLLINELTTNAAKHSTGEIRLSLVQDGRHAILKVSNEGDGFPPHFDPVRDAHTGMGLILSFARHDLRGTIEFYNPPEGGACVVVRFPIPSFTR